MLEKSVFAKGMEKLLAVYPSWKVDNNSPDVMRTWYFMFNDWSNARFTTAVERYVKSEEFPPTVAKLRKYGWDNNDIHEVKDVDATEFINEMWRGTKQ